MPDLSIYFRGTPWSLPIVAVAAVVLLAAAPAAGRRLRVGAILFWLAAMSIVGFLSVTITPTGSWRPWGADWNFSWAYDLPRPGDLLRPDYDTLNIWLALPMGFFVALCAIKRSNPTLVALPFVLAIGAELLQTAIPPMGRSAFLLTDVINTCAGALLGIGLASLLRTAAQRAATGSAASARR
jgi:hypothetical protein